MMWWTFLLACGSADPPTGGAGGPPRDPSDPADTAPLPVGPTADTGPAVPILDEALAAYCGDPPTPPTAPEGEGSLHRLTLGAPDALCNDGTPAVVFLRAALDSAHADDWVVHLEGGSFCEDWQTCATRWCGQRGLMSSAGQPQVKGAAGLPGLSLDNPFRDWNVVVVEYCSSDLWVGRVRDQVVEGSPTYRLHFAGKAIVDAALDVLQDGATSDDGEVSLPSIDDASTVLFAGSSAGGWGAAQHLDDVAARLDGAVYGGIDGMFPAAVDTLPADVRAGVEVEFTSRWERSTALFDPYVDSDCAAVHTGTEAWWCADMSVLLPDHVSTPYVVLSDLADTVVGEPYLEAGLSTAEWAAASELTVRRLLEERPDVAGWASRCGQHTTLRSNPWSFQVPVQDAVSGSPPATVAEVLAARIAGQAMSRVAGADGTGVVCP